MIAPYLTDGVLPIEAVQINGTYIENLLTGYKTLYTKGRESLAIETVSYSVGSSNGDNILYTRYPARIITVGFVLGAELAEQLRAKFNQLNEILKNEEAQFIFHDEQDKFFVGIPIMSAEIEDRQTTVTGEWKIYCADPFKYSVTEYEVTAVDGVITATYNGTHPASPIFDVKFGEDINDADCGFVSFLNTRENIIQIGDVEEVDAVLYPKSQTLVRSDGNGLLTWTTNSGTFPWTDTNYSGTWKTVSLGASSFITPQSYGTPTGAVSGPSIVKTIPPDASYVVGAENFTASLALVFGISNSSNGQRQYGRFWAGVYGDNNDLIAGVMLQKNKSGKHAKILFFAGGVKKEEITIEVSYYNLRFGFPKTLSNGQKTKPARGLFISKYGNTIIFNVAGIIRKYHVPTSVVAKSFLISCLKYKNLPALNANYIQQAKFTKHNCTTYEDTPNKFSAGDALITDCNTGEIFVNGIPRPELGALGNDWEDFVLKSGTNTINVTHSFFTLDLPTIKMRYREVFK